MSDCEEVISICDSSELESIIKVEMPQFETPSSAYEEICDLTEKDCAAVEENPVIEVDDTLQPAVVLCPLDKAAINWWRGRSSRVNVKSPAKEIVSISDNIVIDLTGDEEPESVKVDECPAFSNNSSTSTFRKKRNFHKGKRRLNFCKCCFYETRDIGHFNRHLLSATHRRNQKVCDKKSAKVGENDSRNVSSREPKDQPPISNFGRLCEICGLNFRSESLMMLHWQEEHFKVHGDRSVWIESAKKSKRITRSVYNHTGSHTCSVCRKIFSTEASLIRHKTVHAAYFMDMTFSDTEQSNDETALDPSEISTSVTPETQKYFCKMCNYEPTRKNDLLRHLKTKMHLMNEIDRMTAPVDQSTQCIHDHNEPRCCQINLQSKVINFLGSGSIFNNHNSVVNGQGAEIKETEIKTPMTRQKMVTADVKPLKVTTCSCCYKQVNVKFLKAHMKQKHRKRFFSCQECTEVFNYSEHLRMHFLDMHFSGPLSRCHCGAAYKNIWDLSRHQPVHNPPIICLICKRIFNARSSLSSHWKNWHAQIYGGLREYKEHLEKTLKS